MSIYCPITNGQVLYLQCQECEEKECRKVKKHLAVLIAGSRTYNNYTEFSNILDHLLCNYLQSPSTITIISGGARGADAMAERYAREHRIPLLIFPADWSKYRKKAGYIRNRQMHEKLSEFDNRHLIAFWDGNSKGTKQNFPLAKEFQTPVTCFNYVKGIFEKV